MSDESNDVDARLDERLAAVKRDVPPRRDLWAGIEARLEPRTAAELETPRVPRPRFGAFGAGARWPVQLAAGLGLVALVTIIAVSIGLRAPGGTPTQAASGPEAGGPAANGALAPSAGPSRGPLLSAAFEAPQDERYRSTRAAMETRFREGLAVLAPDTRTRIEQNLELIRRANADIRAALAADPNSTLLHQLLESTWQQEIDLYTTVSRNVAPALARNET